MSNKNILLMLHDGLSRETDQKLYPTDLASLLGYGGTQIKQYFKWAKDGEIKKPNERLERVCSFAYRLGELEGFSSLFPLIPKLAGEMNGDEWQSKKIASDSSTAGQLDLIDSHEPESDSQTKPNFGFASPLNLPMLKQDTKSGHIPVEYDVLIAKLTSMFGEYGHYDFSQVKAALVAIECPEMVEPQASENEPSLIDSVTKYCHDELPHNEYDESDRETLAVKIVTACEQLNLIGTFGLTTALRDFIVDLAKQENRLTNNIRLVRNALRDSSKLRGVIEVSESAQQMSDIVWPDFVDERTRTWLKDYDKAKIREALSYGGELVVNRVLEGFVKEAQSSAIEQAAKS